HERRKGAAHVVAPSYLGWSIFNTLCCCLPLGIPAIIFSCKAQNANTLGESAIAEEASRTAKTLNIIGTVFGVIIIIVWITTQEAGKVVVFT
uniref:Uncharacterized protein n=1 Tax=Oreochromis niloticus TaxID=8128 RepID=A0A669E4B3_ORENI